MPPSAELPIEITIVDSSAHKRDCDNYCGVDWASPESIKLARQRIKERFGDRVKLDYLDLAIAEANPEAPKLKEQVKEGKLTLPALVISGEARISGQFDIRLLLDAIDAETEIRPRKLRNVNAGLPVILDKYGLPRVLWKFGKPFFALLRIRKEVVRLCLKTTKGVGLSRR